MWSFKPMRPLSSGAYPALEWLSQLVKVLPTEALDKFAHILGMVSYKKSPISDWLRGICAPNYRRSLKLWCLLELLGCRVAETENMFPETKVLAWLIGFDSYSENDAAESLDMRVKDISGLLTGKSYLMTSTKASSQFFADRLGYIQLCLELQANVINALHASLVEELKVVIQDIVIPEPRKKPQGVSEPRVNGIAEPPAASTLATTPLNLAKAHHPRAIEILAHQVQAMLALVELIASDEFSPEERAELRERAGEFSIFRLKNRLVALCGERVRNEVNKGE